MRLNSVKMLGVYRHKSLSTGFAFSNVRCLSCCSLASASFGKYAYCRAKDGDSTEGVVNKIEDIRDQVHSMGKDN